jgi:hypothetical protein
MHAPSGLLKYGLLLLLLTAGLVCNAQSRPAAVNMPVETSAAWLARVRPLPHRAQVAALRERLRADARRTFWNDQLPHAACFMGVSAATRVAWEAARRAMPDTVVHDYRLLCVVNGRLLSGGSEAAAAVADVPASAIRHLTFLTSPAAEAVYGSRAGGGVVLLKMKK